MPAWGSTACKEGAETLDELLRMEHVSKRFGDFYANRDINLSVRKGEVHTLLGENGAGKSTLMNVLIGLYQPTEGKIFLNGKEVRIDSPAQAVKLGIGMVHQHFMLVEAMTVFENIILGDRNTRGIFIDREARRKEILELAERYGLDVELDRPITEIAVGAQQRVEILKTLYRGAELLILDEPTAALTDIEVEGLFQIIHKLTEEGKSVIFISHKMREVLQISDRITILRTGEVITTLDRSETDGQELANLMIGRELAPSHYGKVEEPGDPVIQMRSVDYHKESKHAGLSGVSLTVGRGEIVGIAGVDGNGQSQLAQVVTGVLTPDGGEVDMKGSKVAQFTPNGFILENVSHIPEDRNKMGLIGNMSVKDNIVLKATDSPEFSSAKGYFLKKKAIRDYALKMQEKYDICGAGDAEPLRRQPAEGDPGPGAGGQPGPAGGRPPHPGPGYRRHPLRPRHHDRGPGQGLRRIADLRGLRRNPGGFRPHRGDVRGADHGRVLRQKSSH